MVRRCWHRPYEACEWKTGREALTLSWAWWAQWLSLRQIAAKYHANPLAKHAASNLARLESLQSSGLRHGMAIRAALKCHGRPAGAFSWWLRGLRAGGR